MLCRSRSVLNQTYGRHFSLSATNNGKVLVLAEHDGGKVASSTYNTVSAASQLGDVEVLVVGENCGSAATRAAEIKGVSKVIKVESPELAHPTAERLAQVLLSEQGRTKYTHILSASSTSGKGVIPRLGALLDVQPISDVQKIISEDTFVRPIYAGNALLTLRSKDAVKLITVRATGFPAAEKGDSVSSIEDSAAPAFTGASQKAKWESSQIETSERPELTSADIVVSGGRGIKAKENMSLIYSLADAMGGAVGVSRAVVDAEWASNDLQVGQTGKIVAPNLYVAVGISGAIQHLAGMMGSKTIVAINTDADAPIFSVADYGLVADLFTTIPEMVKEINEHKN